MMLLLPQLLYPTDPIDFSGTKVEVKGDNASDDDVLVVNTFDDDISTD